MEIFIVVVFTCRRMHYVNEYKNSSHDPSHDPSQHGFNVNSNVRILVSTEKVHFRNYKKNSNRMSRQRSKRRDKNQTRLLNLEVKGSSVRNRTPPRRGRWRKSESLLEADESEILASKIFTPGLAGAHLKKKLESALSVLSLSSVLLLVCRLEGKLGHASDARNS